MTPLIAVMAGMVVANIFYGFYLNLFITSTYLLSRRFTGEKAGPFYRSIIFISTTFLFASVTAGFILFEAGPTAFLGDPTQATSVALNVVSLASIFFNDLLMVYRLYIIWCRAKLVMIVPVLAWIGFTVCAVLIVVDARTTPDLALVTSMTPSFVFTLVLSRQVDDRFCQFEPQDLSLGRYTPSPKPARLWAEPIFGSWALFYAVTHQINDNSQYIAVATLPPIAGIANALVQTRIGMGKSVQPASTQLSQPIRFRTNIGRSTTEAAGCLYFDMNHSMRDMREILFMEFHWTGANKKVNYDRDMADADSQQEVINCILKI
ncbi:hypothetical protein B0H12DRAFT_1079963 [Mycena haematopus]|nr:hypothetical protein B0H12DRAFT_1079963 [Mycena haematopus]